MAQPILRSPDTVSRTHSDHHHRSPLLSSFRLHSAALQACEEHLAVEPSNVLGWANLSFAQLELDNISEAHAAADRAVELDPKSFEAWRAKGNALAVHARNVELAVECFQRAIAIRPDDWYVQFAMGKILLRAKQPADAIVALQKAVELNPQATVALSHLAICLSDMRCGPEARRTVEQALEIDPRDSAAWAVRGMIIWQFEGNRDEAVASFEMSLKFDENNEQARSFLQRLKI